MVARVALVTGAGSPTGIGFATAKALAQDGVIVALASTTDRIHERANELAERGGEAVGFVADLTDRGRARSMVAEVLERFGRINILVNNAGMVSVDKTIAETTSFLDLSDQGWDDEIAMNLGTAYNVTRTVVPGMVLV